VIKHVGQGPNGKTVEVWRNSETGEEYTGSTPPGSESTEYDAFGEA
jgi:hypothetical protein